MRQLVHKILGNGHKVNDNGVVYERFCNYVVVCTKLLFYVL